MTPQRRCRLDDARNNGPGRSRRKGNSIPRSWVVVTITLLLVFGACTTFASPISSTLPSTELSPIFLLSSLSTTTTTTSTESVAQQVVPEKILLASLLTDNTTSEPSPTPVPQPTSTNFAPADILPLDLNALPIFLASTPSSDSPSLASTSAVPSANGTTGPITGGGSAGDDANSPLILDVGQKTRVTSVNVALGVIFLILGLVQTFYGFKFIRLTLLLTGFLSCAVIAILIMVSLNWQLNYYVFRPSHYVFWVWFLVALTGGIICFRFWDLGVTFAGAFGGFTIALAIVAVSDRHISTTSRYVLLVALVLICAALATMFERVAVILCTSFGGSYMFMYGLDGFLQVGYREMIVIFQFTGRSLTYHPNRKVFYMIGGWVALALLGVAWEFWHHETPILMDRRAIFRIYGRPFGKRPQKLIGQKLKGHVQSMDWYQYLSGCFCLRRNTVEDVLNQPMDDDFVVVVGAAEDMEGKKEQDTGNKQQEQQSSSISTVQGSDDMSSESGEQLVETDVLSSKTASCHEDEKPSSEEEQDLEQQTGSAVQVLIEETDYQVEGDGEALVVLGTHTESAISAAASSSSNTEKSTSVTLVEHTSSSSSNTIAGQHLQELSKTTMSSSSSSATRVISTSSTSASTSSHAMETVADRPSLSIVQEHHHLSTTSMTTARSVVYSSSTTTTATTTESHTASGTTTTTNVDSTTTSSS